MPQCVGRQRTVCQFLLPSCRSQDRTQTVKSRGKHFHPWDTPPSREHILNDLNYLYLFMSEYDLTVNLPYTLEKEVCSPGHLLVCGPFSKIHREQAGYWGHLGFLYFC